MTMTDPISDMLTRVRNAVMAGHTLVAIPSSKMKVSIAEILKSEGFIEDYEVAEQEETAFKVLRIKLKYVGDRRDRRSVISGLERVSKPGRRVYAKRTEIPWILSGLGVRHSFHVQGRDERSHRPQARLGRRSALQGLVGKDGGNMSRVGRMPIEVPSGVEVTINELDVKVKGPKGELSHSFPAVVEIKRDGEQIVVERKDDEKFTRSMHGTARAILNNMVVGVSEGFSKELEVRGVGYRPELKGKQLILHVGYSHPVQFPEVEGISYEVDDKAGEIKVMGHSKEVVGEVAARIRKVRPPEPYKGKGIRYKGEYVRQKAGKAGKAV